MMKTARKITVEVPAELLERAQRAGGAGITQTAGTLAAGPTYAQLSALAGAVDRSYYQTGSFMASPTVETFLRFQVSTTGKPLYKVDPDTGLLTIAGRVLYPNAAMPAAGTPSAPLVLFGDYSKEPLHRHLIS